VKEKEKKIIKGAFINNAAKNNYTDKKKYLTAHINISSPNPQK